MTALANQLPALAAPTRVVLSGWGLTGVKPNSALVQWEFRSGRGVVAIPKTDPIRFQNSTRVLILDETQSGRLANINVALKGGTRYPVLTGALSLLPVGGQGFTVIETLVELSRRNSDVLARSGDEIWFLEQLGRYNGRPEYVKYFFLHDPYRSEHLVTTKGWLLHEERYELMI